MSFDFVLCILFGNELIVYILGFKEHVQHMNYPYDWTINHTEPNDTVELNAMKKKGLIG